MNRQFHKKRQSLKVTDKQAGVGKLFGKSKKNKKKTGHMLNIKLEQKWKKKKWVSKLYLLKYSVQKTDMRGGHIVADTRAYWGR